MGTTTDGVVFITSPTTIPKNQEVVISWKTDKQDILGFKIRIGIVAGEWDIFNGQLGENLREVRLPGLPDNLTPLFVEFGYVVPSIAPSNANAMMHDHDSSENVLLNEEPLEITRV